MPIDPAIVQGLTIGGAAFAFFLMLKWLADGRFHTDSEVQGLKQDKVDMLALNKELTAALKRSNELLKKALERGQASE